MQLVAESNRNSFTFNVLFHPLRARRFSSSITGFVARDGLASALYTRPILFFSASRASQPCVLSSSRRTGFRQLRGSARHCVPASLTAPLFTQPTALREPCALGLLQRNRFSLPHRITSLAFSLHCKTVFRSFLACNARRRALRSTLFIVVKPLVLSPHPFSTALRS